MAEDALFMTKARTEKEVFGKAAVYFAETRSFSVGDIVDKNAEIYKCIVSHPAGEWEPSHFRRLLVGEGGGSGGAVDSVNGKIGDVLLTGDDIYIDTETKISISAAIEDIGSTASQSEAKASQAKASADSAAAIASQAKSRADEAMEKAELAKTSAEEASEDAERAKEDASSAVQSVALAVKSIKATVGGEEKTASPVEGVVDITSLLPSSFKPLDGKTFSLNTGNEIVSALTAVIRALGGNVGDTKPTITETMTMEAAAEAYRLDPDYAKMGDLQDAAGLADEAVAGDLITE